MTKDGAILAMMNGRKVSHKYFSPDEWVTMEGNEYLFEDGVICSSDEFWRWRKGEEWETGWTLFE